MTTTKTQRRGFLGALFAAPVVAVTPAIAARAPEVESPALLAIGARLPDFVARTETARARFDEAKAAHERLKPVVPPEIVAPVGERGDLTEMERGLNNEPVRHEFDGRRVFWDLYSSRKVKAHIILRELSRHTKEGRRLRRIARLAERFERDSRAAIIASGYPEARSALLTLRMELQDDFAKAALATKPLTMPGLGIYAGIIVACNGPANYDGQPVGYCNELGMAMAEAFNRLAATLAGREARNG